MTDQFTTLTPAGMRQIIENLDASIAVLDRHRGKMTAQQIQIKSMLTTVRRQLEEQLRSIEDENSARR